MNPYDDLPDELDSVEAVAIVTALTLVVFGAVLGALFMYMVMRCMDTLNNSSVPTVTG